MTVAELIEELKNMPQSAGVLMQVEPHVVSVYAGVGTIHARDRWFNASDDNPKGTVVFLGEAF